MSCSPVKKLNYPVGFPTFFYIPFLLQDKFQTKYELSMFIRSGRFHSCIEKFPFLIKNGSSLMKGVYHYKHCLFTLIALLHAAYFFISPSSLLAIVI